MLDLIIYYIYISVYQEHRGIAGVNEPLMICKTVSSSAIMDKESGTPEVSVFYWCSFS